MTLHSNLGASKASMWMNCHGWYNGFMALPGSQRDSSGIAADEGTAAHTLGEYVIKNEFSTAREFIGRTIPGEFQSWPVTREMADAVDMWHDSVRDHVERLQKKYPDEEVKVVLEHRVEPLEGREEEIFGTSDTIIYCDSEIVAIDFKYGKGIIVEIEFNDQLMFYGLGALRKFAPEAEVATLEIVQPRAKHEAGFIRPWEIEASVLHDYASTMEAAVSYAKRPDAPRVAGDHCKPFCPMATKCPELDKLSVSVARSDFQDLDVLAEKDVTPEHVTLPDLSDPKQMSRAMKLVPLVTFWAKKVKEAAEELALAGVSVEGHKLVRKRANRAWDDENDVEQKLRNRGVRVGTIFNQKLRSPAQLEKEPEIGKKWVEKYCYKPEGGLTLVAESDKRKALIPEVLTDFQALPDDPDSGI
ncbi:hypothetical protein LCGC14_0651520 [marine sediment metagenome]|uniref:Uncharacterized protein n=1 Tax=marine sediment metagenome TaxID=412755 RepID=A0A0F9QW30_9ZZZZ